MNDSNTTTRRYGATPKKKSAKKVAKTSAGPSGASIKVKPTQKKRITKTEVKALVSKHEPFSLILDIMEAAKAAGWPRGYVLMETDAGNTGELITKGGLSETMQKHMRETLRDAKKPPRLT